MSVNAKLLAVFRVEKQIQGLRSRLRGSERFLAEQTRQVDTLTQTVGSLEGQRKQLAAKILERESEAQRVDARMTELREKMSSASTNREYQGFLTEINTLKTSKSEVDDEVLGLMTQAEELDQQLEGAKAQLGERETLKAKAGDDRAEREKEIADRLAELEGERAEAAKDVPKDKLAMLESLVAERGDEAMASIDILDKRRHEACCEGCMMTLPVEVLSSLMRNVVTNCPNCGVLLYIEEAAAAKLAPAKR